MENVSCCKLWVYGLEGRWAGTFLRHFLPFMVKTRHRPQALFVSSERVAFGRIVLELVNDVCGKHPGIIPTGLACGVATEKVIAGQRMVPTEFDPTEYVFPELILGGCGSGE